MNIRIILSFIAFTFLFGAFGQNNSVIDSLKSIIRTAKEDTIKVNNLCSLSQEYLIINDLKSSIMPAISCSPCLV